MNYQSNGITLITDRGTRLALCAYCDPTMTDRKAALNAVRTGQLAQDSAPEGPRPSTFGNVSVSSAVSNAGPSALDITLIQRVGQTFSAFRSAIFGRGSQAANFVLPVQHLTGVEFLTESDIDTALALLRERLIGHLNGKYSYCQGPVTEKTFDPNERYSSFDHDLEGEAVPVASKTSSSRTRKRRV